jgi:hypothetical protein
MVVCVVFVPVSSTSTVVAEAGPKKIREVAGSYTPPTYLWLPGLTVKVEISVAFVSGQNIKMAFAL